jgi:hypothetical protein
MKLMETLKKIWDYLSTPKGQRNTLIVALIICILYFRGCGSGTSPIDTLQYEQNIAALQDSVRSYKGKNGTLVYEKLALMTSQDDLDKYNKELADELKNLKDHPLVVIKWNTKIVHDTIRIPVTAGNSFFNTDHSVRTTPFTWKDSTFYSPGNYHIIGGKYFVEVDTNMNAKSRDFLVTTDEFGMSFVTGLTENKAGKVEIFVTSKYPGFKPTTIEGALFDPRESEVIKKYFPPKRWSAGPYAGYGVYFDPVNMRVGSGITLGISVTYGIFQWKGKK